jgi:HSP20 family protein
MAGKENRSDGPLTASVEKLRGELDHWLEVAMTQGGKALNAFGFRNADKPWNPAVDMVETPDDVFVDVSLPGADPGSIEVTIAGNLLTIKGETPDLQIGSDDTAHVKQRNHGKFQGSIPMPTPVDADSVSASSSNGVLTVRLAKTERAKVRQIPVSADSAPTQTPTTHMES